MSKKRKRPGANKARQLARPGASSPAADAGPAAPPKKSKPLLLLAVVLVVCWIAFLAGLAYMSRFGGG